MSTAGITPEDLNNASSVNVLYRGMERACRWSRPEGWICGACEQGVITPTGCTSCHAQIHRIAIFSPRPNPSKLHSLARITLSRNGQECGRGCQLPSGKVVVEAVPYGPFGDLQLYDSLEALRASGLEVQVLDTP